jgi:hypothetical protein
MQVLRQSTAATVAIGPFVDGTDGATAETALTLSQADIRLSRNGAAFAQKSESSASAHMENGWYSCALNATDTGTVGHLTIAVNESGALPVWHQFQVVEEAVYDALYAASAAGYPTAIENADALLDRSNAIETGLTPRGALRLNTAALAGEVSGAGTGTETFRNAVADSKNRIVSTVDVDGNRTAVATDTT